ncbi:HCLS1-associated protein X-1-like [Liolophura sinensis]|uniref:HCLS1-associated protein X-1-like n=1 Tax=Liolophura sinensis TaxID=3198878 RepID=UPI00315815CF
MSLNDIFRSFFGIRPREDISARPDVLPFDDDDQENEGGFGNMDDIFRHFQGDMMQQMEEIHRQMEDMFNNLGVTEFSSLTPGPENSLSPPDGGDLRDKMLKANPDNPSKEESGHTREPLQPFPGSSVFEGMFRLPNWNPVKSHEKKDQDLDNEVSAGDLSKLFETLGSEVVPRQPPCDRPRVRSGFHSVSVQKIHKPDGTIEERRVSRDSAGNEETTVTRSLGDKSHTIITRKNSAGEEEVVQNFTNLDEDKLPQFDKLWGPDQGSLPLINPPSDKLSDFSLFKKFFGFDKPDSSR